MSFFRSQLENYLKGLDVVADRVLDIGGSSNPVKKRVNSWKVKEYKILDNNLEEGLIKDFVKPDYVCDINHDVYGCGSLVECEKGTDYINFYDVIFMLEVAEYIWNPLMALQNIYKLLVEGGYAIISFPLLYPIHEPKGHDYLRYTEEGIEKLLKEVGFKNWEIDVRVSHPEAQYFLNEFYKIDGMHFRKGDNSRFHTGYIVKAFK